MIRALFILINSLPEVLGLIKALQEAADQAEKDRKVKDDIKTIHEAFTSNDPKKLQHLFNSI